MKWSIIGQLQLERYLIMSSFSVSQIRLLFARPPLFQNLQKMSLRVVFMRENFFLFFCFLQSGNLSDSNNPLTKMHTLTHIGHLKYIVEKSMKWSTKFKISSLVIMFILDKLNLAQNMAFFGHLDNYNDQKCHDLS